MPKSGSPCHWCQEPIKLDWSCPDEIEPSSSQGWRSRADIHKCSIRHLSPVVESSIKATSCQILEGQMSWKMHWAFHLQPAQAPSAYKNACYGQAAERHRPNCAYAMVMPRQVTWEWKQEAFIAYYQHLVPNWWSEMLGGEGAGLYVFSGKLSTSFSRNCALFSMMESSSSSLLGEEFWYPYHLPGLKNSLFGS